jgi:hypothetical protein
VRTFIAGTIFGIVVATVGFSGIAKMIDTGITTVKEKSVEYSK